MMRTVFQRTPLRLLSIFLLLSALAVVVLPTFAQDGADGQAPLVPNVEPVELNQNVAVLSEQEAVEATLRAFAERGDPQPPAGAILDLPADLAVDAAQQYHSYLPLLRARLVSEAPATVTPTPVTPTPVTPEPEEKAADVAVVLWPKPSIWVARGALLEYEIRLINYGRGSADKITVVFPYNRSQYTLESTSLSSKAGDWVSKIEQNSFTVTFGHLDAGARRSGKIFLRIKGDLAYQTLLNIRASYDVNDGVTGGDQGRSNWAPVLVGSGASDAPYIWLSVQPDRGPAGTKHTFVTNRLLPGEPVTTWLNTPQGVKPLSLRGTANSEGIVSLAFTSSGLARGTYQLVAYGNRSGLTGVASFIVQ